MYYTATEYGQWEPTAAKTLRAAKAVASSRNPYVGQPLVKVGIMVTRDDVEIPERVETVAVKCRGVWVDQGYPSPAGGDLCW